jgi:hypothetical protein
VVSDQAGFPRCTAVFRPVGFRRGTVPVMAGGDEPQGRDVDDWFDEPQPPRGRRARPRGDDASAVGENEDDWLGGGTARVLRRPSAGALADLSPRGRAIAIAVAIVVLLLVGLAVGGVFSGSKPHPAASLTLTHPAGTTTAPTTTKSSSVAAPAATLKPGDSGAQVKVLQRALASLGYAPGTIDGAYGPATQSAVVKFQRASNLTADGIVGPKTLAALRTALTSQ